MLNNLSLISLGKRVAILMGILSVGLFADGESSAVAIPASAMFTVNNTWMLIATLLVFIMHLGFACLETGLTRAKNATNILFKNTAIVSIGLLTYAICGFNLMYPGFAEGSSGI